MLCGYSCKLPCSCCRLETARAKPRDELRQVTRQFNKKRYWAHCRGASRDSVRCRGRWCIILLTVPACSWQDGGESKEPKVLPSQATFLINLPLSRGQNIRCVVLYASTPGFGAAQGGCYLAKLPGPWTMLFHLVPKRVTTPTTKQVPQASRLHRTGTARFQVQMGQSWQSWQNRRSCRTHGVVTKGYH